MKHTKEEWIVQDSLDRLEVIVKHPEHNVINRIALITNWNSRLPNYKKAEANAKLIAAAPELLEVCKKAIRLSNLWVYDTASTDIEFADEAEAIGKLENELKEVIKKATDG